MASFEVRLTRGAEHDLEALHRYLSEHRSPDQADALLDKLLGVIETLETLTMRGSIPEELGEIGIKEFRQILLPPYRLIYRIVDTIVFVIVIADGRRDMQAMLERRLLGS